MSPIDVGIVLLAAAAVCLIAIRRWYRLPTREHPAVLSPLHALLLLAFMVMAAHGGAWLAARWAGIELPFPSDRTPTVETYAQLAVGRYAAQGALAVAFLALAATRARSRRPGPGRAALLGVGALALVWPMTAVSGWVAGLILTALGHAPPRVAHETLRMLLDAEVGVWPLMLALMVVVAAPIVEEVMYRGLLQDLLRRREMPPWVAITATSIVFALMHWSAAEPNAVVALFVLSMGFGWIYERTGRLAAPIAMHALFNAGNLVLASVQG